MTNNLFSLLNYIGHKSKILDDIFNIAPENVDGVFWDIFCGSSVVGLSCPYGKVVCVDTNQYLIELYSNLCNPLFTNKLNQMIEEYSLTNSSIKPRSEYLKDPNIGTCTWHGETIKNLHLDQLNKGGYMKMLNDFNMGKFKSPVDRGIAYMILTLYGRNSNVTLKRDGKLVGGVGPLDFSVKSAKKLQEHVTTINKKNISWTQKSYKDINPTKEDFVYLDPPYFASGFKYSGWSEEDELSLLNWIDKLPCNWILSNVFVSGKDSNTSLIEWSKKYKIVEVNKNYRKWAARGKSTAKRNNKKNIEVLITNLK